MGEDVMAEHALARRLAQADIEGFLGLGVPPLALARSCWGDWAFIGRERIVLDGAGRFEFERHAGVDGVNAYTVMLFDSEGQPADILGFRPAARALWLGRVALVGAEQLFLPRGGEPLDIHSDVLDWLCADRRGVVVLDAARALDDLRAAAPLRVATVEQGRALRHAFHAALPTIVVRERPPVPAEQSLDAFAAQLHRISA